MQLGECHTQIAPSGSQTAVLRHALHRQGVVIGAVNLGRWCARSGDGTQHLRLGARLRSVLDDGDAAVGKYNAQDLREIAAMARLGILERTAHQGGAGKGKRVHLSANSCARPRAAALTSCHTVSKSVSSP